MDEHRIDIMSGDRLAAITKAANDRVAADHVRLLIEAARRFPERFMDVSTEDLVDGLRRHRLSVDDVLHERGFGRRDETLVDFRDRFAHHALAHVLTDPGRGYSGFLDA